MWALMAFHLIFWQYFEQDDPDLYLSKVKYILDHDVEDMDLFFVEEEYDKTGQLLKVNDWYCDTFNNCEFCRCTMLV